MIRIHRTHAQSDWINPRTAANIPEDISIVPKKHKPPNSPVGAKIRCIGEMNESGSHADGLTVCTDMLSIETDTKMAENASRKVKMCHRRPKTRNSPIGHEIKTVKHPGWWKHVSDEGNNTNAPIKLLGTQNREIAFGLLLERYLVAEVRCCGECWRQELSWHRDGKWNRDVQGYLWVHGVGTSTRTRTYPYPCSCLPELKLVVVDGGRREKLA